MQAKDDEIAELARTVAGLQSALDDEGAPAPPPPLRRRAPSPRPARRAPSPRRSPPAAGANDLRSVPRDSS
jgi:hypothetical protein